MVFRQPFLGSYPITQRFGEKDTSAFHTGVDYALPEGTAVVAAEMGTVWRCEWDFSGYGNMVLIRHGDGSGSLYGHLSHWVVSVGQVVKKGEVIGFSGNTGNSTGPHLHFEVRTQADKADTIFDPLPVTRSEPDPKPVPVVLKEPAELPKAIRVVCPAGAKVFSAGFEYSDGAIQGSRWVFTGETKRVNGYTYCQVYRPSDLRWIAVHDGETQILDE